MAMRFGWDACREKVGDGVGRQPSAEVITGRERERERAAYTSQRPYAYTELEGARKVLSRCCRARKSWGKRYPSRARHRHARTHARAHVGSETRTRREPNGNPGKAAAARRTTVGREREGRGGAHPPVMAERWRPRIRQCAARVPAVSTGRRKSFVVVVVSPLIMGSDLVLRPRQLERWKASGRRTAQRDRQATRHGHPRAVSMAQRLVGNKEIRPHAEAHAA